MGKVWTPEARKAAGDRLRAAKEAKKAAIAQAAPPVAERPQPIKLSPQSVAAGIQQPSGESTVRANVIQQISLEAAEADLDELGVDDWVKKHYDQKDFSIDSMAGVLRESREDIYNRLHAYGYELPQGTYNANV